MTVNRYKLLLDISKDSLESAILDANYLFIHLFVFNENCGP